MEQLLITKKGLQKLKQELEYLKTIKRKEIAARIEEAKEYGDISESSEYEDAKNEQALLESRIAEVEGMIRGSKIIAKSRGRKKVGYGSSVEVLMRENKRNFKIVGAAESDPEKGEISCDSPIGKALLGLKKGEIAKVNAPSGKTIKYKVTKIE